MVPVTSSVGVLRHVPPAHRSSTRAMPWNPSHGLSAAPLEIVDMGANGHSLVNASAWDDAPVVTQARGVARG
jgi:hypothetical protein